RGVENSGKERDRRTRFVQLSYLGGSFDKRRKRVRVVKSYWFEYRDFISPNSSSLLTLPTLATHIQGTLSLSFSFSF
ncbi:hypothetical protein GIB67_032177, partial [Kingdonia uniflora]